LRSVEKAGGWLAFFLCFVLAVLLFHESFDVSVFGSQCQREQLPVVENEAADSSCSTQSGVGGGTAPARSIAGLSYCRSSTPTRVLISEEFLPPDPTVALSGPRSVAAFVSTVPRLPGTLSSATIAGSRCGGLLTPDSGFPLMSEALGEPHSSRRVVGLESEQVRGRSAFSRARRDNSDEGGHRLSRPSEEHYETKVRRLDTVRLCFRASASLAPLAVLNGRQRPNGIDRVRKRYFHSRAKTWLSGREEQPSRSKSGGVVLAILGFQAHSTWQRIAIA